MHVKPIAYILLLVFYFFCFFIPVTVIAQGKGNKVEVRSISPKLQESPPGSILSMSFIVTNRSDKDELFIERLQLPEGWQAVIPSGNFTLRPSESATRIIAFQIPRNQPAGRYEITYGVQSQRDYAIQDSDTVAVVVLPVTKLALLTEDKPESVIAGKMYKVKLRLINQSNVGLKANLEVKSTERYPAKIEPKEVTLPAGKSEPVAVTVETDRDERSRHTHYVHIKAQSDEIEKKGASTGITVGVEIIPQVSGELDIYHRLPAELTMRVSGEDNRAGMQMELRGEGTLDEEKKRHIEFLFRGPDTQDKGMFGQYDEYKLNYLTSDIDVRSGDQSYSLSPLTSYYHYGRGAGVDLHIQESPIGFGGYYLKERWRTPDLKESALYATGRITDSIQTRLNLLHKEIDAYENVRSIHDNIWSFETRYKLKEKMNIQMEYAYSDSDKRGWVKDDVYRSDRGKRVKDDAYRIEWDGSIAKTGYYRVAKFHAEPDYYGYYHDTDSSYASLSYPLGPRLQGHASFNRWKDNLDLRPDSSTANRETLWEGGVTYAFTKRWDLSVDYGYFQRYDAFAPRDFDYTEQAVKIGIGHSAKKYSTRIEVRTGRQKDHLTDRETTICNYKLFATYQPNQKTFFTIYGGFGNYNTLNSSRLLGGSNDLGASVAWNPTQNLNLDFWYTKYNFNNTESEPESDSYRFGLRYRLPNRHQIGIQAEHDRGEWREDKTSYMLTYTIPFGLPVSKKKNVGSIKGFIYDEKAPDKHGISGVILNTNGRTAVTDANGRFIFPTVAPGTHQIYVDRASIGMEKVTAQKLPITVEVAGGQSSQIDVGIVGSAKVFGKVLVISGNGNGKNENGNNLNGNSGNGGVVVGEPEGESGKKEKKEPTGIADALVELSNGQETLRRITDQKGEFLFESVRPGVWHMKVYDHNIPTYHYIETAEQDINLEPGQSQEVTIRILPKVREIKFIDSGVIQPDKKQK